jgi:FkbM family methyltransferase
MISPVIDHLFEQLESSLRKEARPLFETEAPVYIYGAGNIGKDVCRLLRGQGLRVAGFLDRNAQPGGAWEGVSILLPDDPAISALERKRAHVVIGIFNFASEIPPIITLLDSLGFGRITTFLDLHDEFASDLGDRYWLTARSFYQDKKEQVAAGYELWSDETSRDLYASVLRFRFSKNYAVLPTPSPQDQYFPKGLPPWPNPVRFIDCGAFDGDTLRQLAEKGIPVEALAAFEPDPANFQKLARTTETQLGKLNATISLFPCGVSSATTQLRFSCGAGTSSAQSDAGDTTIQVVALDDALAGFRPNIIKMDIEGAEYDALRGARRIIEQNRPHLALCVYHVPEHLWTIPLLANEYVKDAKHYLRLHAYNGWELVYYLVP